MMAKTFAQRCDKVIFQNCLEPCQTTETAAVQQRGRDRLQLGVGGADLLAAAREEELEQDQGGDQAPDLETGEKLTLRPGE